MNTKTNFIKPKKIPYYLALTLLTAGASLILGLLSFSGMYALAPLLAITLPALPLAFAAFGLSVSYEGEIYLQNIKGALKKLFKTNYLKDRIAEEFLIEKFPGDTSSPDCPQFFRDYERQLNILEAFNGKKLNKHDRKSKKHLEKKLKAMQQWFSIQLFTTIPKEQREENTYATDLQTWLDTYKAQWQAKLTQRKTIFNLVKTFSTLSAVFMGLGSTYLIVEAFSAIPWFVAIPFASWPLMIVPMALIAGTAYGLLTYNTITDLVNDKTIQSWAKRIHADLNTGFSVRNVLIGGLVVVLIGLALALTICTAGTWWTIAANGRPLFGWMAKMPSFIMGGINTIIIGIAAVSFNAANTLESLSMFYDKAFGNVPQRAYNALVDSWTHLRQTENWVQILNPFRILLKLIIGPLRLILFLGHLISIALTADRMPGVPKGVSGAIATVSEGLEDMHYFFEADSAENANDHRTETQKRIEAHLRDAGHSHEDIPARILKFVAFPLYFSAIIWDFVASKMNPESGRNALSFAQAWNKQYNIKEEETVDMPENTEHPSAEWQKEHALFLLDKYQNKHFGTTVLIGSEIAQNKKKALGALAAKVKASEATDVLSTLKDAKNEPIFGVHRFFGGSAEAATKTFVATLPECVHNTRL